MIQSTRSGKRLLRVAKYPINKEAKSTARAMRLPKTPMIIPVFFFSATASMSSFPFDHANVAKRAKKVKGTKSSSGVEERKKEKRESVKPSKLVR
jgi:hypothetical protein